MTILCRGREFKVHRNVLCPASKFFAAASDGGLKEARTATIDLSEDDPDTLRRILDYLYRADYNDDDSTQVVKAEEDSAQAGDESRTSTRMPGIEDNNNHDTSAQTSTQSTAAKVDLAKKDEVSESPLSSYGTPISAPLNNALVYALAEKYDIQQLKELARCKFEIRSAEKWHVDDIIRVLPEIYKTTPSTDRGLRDIIINVCSRYLNGLMLHKGLRRILHDNSALASEMLDQLHNTALNSGQKIFDLEQDKVTLIDEMRILEVKLKNASTLQGELNLTREEKRLLVQSLQTFSCRHCKRGLALDVLLLGMLTIGPWALLIVYDILLWIFRSILYIIPFVGGRARGKKRPRAPTFSERASGRRRTFSIGGTQLAGVDHSEKDGLRKRILDIGMQDNTADTDAGN
ncbi:MAG: hypothetical protein Q9208_008130 [Pyrenodesmia sp. 3 TL-2023]